MSWFFGRLGETQTAFEKAFKERNNSYCAKYVKGDLCIFFDDRINCAHNFNSASNNADKFLIAGVGISPGEQKHILRSQDWENLLEDGEHHIQLDGHFAGLKFNSIHLTLLTDPIGLRDIYVARNNSNEIFFSTRIDLLLQFVRSEINLEIFGSRWLLFNQISQRSVFKGIDRIVGGSSVTINRFTKEVLKKKFAWLPERHRRKLSSTQFAEKIARVTKINENENSRIGLLLSGGLDSRTLISIILANKIKGLELFTFGNKQNNDVKVAEQISKYLSLPHTIIDPENLQGCNALSDFSSYSVQTLMNNSFTSFLHLQSYNSLTKFDGIIFDGGFGEIWRREFLYKLAFFNRRKILARDFNAILQHLKLHRAEFFEQDVVNKMSDGLRNQIEEIYELLPDPIEIEVENWLDLFAIKTRLANHYSQEQSFLDQSLISVMPFVQQSVLSNLHSVDPHRRKDGKLYKEIIKKYNKGLTKYPLVKGDYTMPFGASSFQTRLFLKMYKMIGKDNSGLHLKYIPLLDYAEQIIDIVSSKSFTESGFYDKRKIENITTHLSSGTADNHVWNEIDWLLAFESFRQSVN
ncbi:MAG: asparagine synthase-related protein [Bacteroidetes bacterium]|nr:asparagine synthase-related protein [Bacteroidota bacterium]